MVTVANTRKGTDRLLAAVRRLDSPVTGPGLLAAAVGDELAHLLVFALAGSQGLRGRGLRGVSSP